MTMPTATINRATELADVFAEAEQRAASDYRMTHTTARHVRASRTEMTSMITTVARQQLTAAECVENSLPTTADYNFFKPLGEEQSALRDAVASARHGLWHAAALRVATEMGGVFLDDGHAGLLTTLNQIAPDLDLPDGVPDIGAIEQRWYPMLSAGLFGWTADQLRAFVKEQAHD